METKNLERALTNLEITVDRLNRTIIEKEPQVPGASEMILEAILEKLTLIAEQQTKAGVSRGSDVGSSFNLSRSAEETIFVDEAGVVLLKTNFHYKEVLTNKPIWISQTEYRVVSLERLERSERGSVNCHVFKVEKV